MTKHPPFLLFFHSLKNCLVQYNYLKITQRTNRVIYYSEISTFSTLNFWRVIHMVTSSDGDPDSGLWESVLACLLLTPVSRDTLSVSVLFA